jgi:hypothetical protein
MRSHVPLEEVFRSGTGWAALKLDTVVAAWDAVEIEYEYQGVAWFLPEGDADTE